MKIWQISFDSQKHEKYALQVQNYIGLSEIGIFSYWIIINIKEYIRNGLVF
jgi:hypothetical protein